MAFPRTHRLTKPIEFKRVFTRPLVSVDALFKVLAKPNELPHARLGMAVSKKVDKRAVGRNRIKRVIRESFGTHWGDFGTIDVDDGDRLFPDIVVLPRRESATICNRQLSRSLDKHWARLSARLEHASDQP